jgi:DNA mismatch repair ATPase MutS
VRPRLAFPDQDLDLGVALPANADALGRDLALDTLVGAMAQGDAFLRGVAASVLLSSLDDCETIRYRQGVLRDCVARPAVVRALYALAVDACESKQKTRHLWFRDSPEASLHKSLRMLELLVDALRRLRALAEGSANEFCSDGFRRLWAIVARDLQEDYLNAVDRHRRELQFRHGPLISATLGRANRGTNYVLRKPNERGLLQRLRPGRVAAYSFTIPDRDEHGPRTLAQLRDRGLNSAANALAQSVDHILGFFEQLRAELGFYVGCLNLRDRLAADGLATCFPEPRPAHETAFAARALYDACLACHLGSGTVGSDVDASGKRLVVITGANGGGKSTFLRSIGLAQLMMQAGMFVPAESMRASVRSGVFTHFKREEDPTLTSGKLAEELERMSEIAEAIAPGGLLLCNESFGSTNEQEGSEIAREVVRAMVEANVTVFYVSHLFDFADSMAARPPAPALFLRAERTRDGNRTFRMVPGAPLATSYGADAFRRIFAAVDPSAGRNES